MIRLQRTLFALASIAFIVIGALHVITHFIVLDTEDVITLLKANGSIDIFGTPAQISDLWLATSILMGAFSATLGLSNLVILSAIKGSPLRAICMVNIAMLMVIFAMGVLYLGPIQMIGGPLGIAFFAFAGFTKRVVL